MKHSHFAHITHGMFLCTAHFVMHQVSRYCWYNDNSDDKCSGWEARWAEPAPGLDTYLYLDHNYCDSLENLDTAPPRYLLSTNNDRPRADPDPSRRIHSHRAISRHSERDYINSIFITSYSVLENRPRLEDNLFGVFTQRGKLILILDNSD